MSRPRKFDWDEARRLRAGGLSYMKIANRLGVSDTSIYLVCNPHALERSKARVAAWQRTGTCLDCGRQISRNATRPVARCRSCHAKRMATSVRPDELQCVTCKEWKPDSEYAHNRCDPLRRNRHGQCRDCNTAARRAWREANRERQRAYDRERKRRKKQQAA